MLARLLPQHACHKLVPGQDSSLTRHIVDVHRPHTLALQVNVHHMLGGVPN
jgi:hypothetical protein